MVEAVTREMVLPESLGSTLRDCGIDAPLGEGTFDYAAAHAYCRHLARTHYENFHVGTWLLPARVREHAHDVYAFCRWADDLGDETGDRDMSLALLDWWTERLDRAMAGSPDHVVFAALAPTIEAFDLPREPFADLIDAFIQDQRVLRYATHADVLDYCTRSADPVGRLVLHLLGYRDAERQALSDRTCTALQLANFWQDVENDIRRGRIYIPLEDMDRFGVNEEDLAMPAANDAFRELLAFQVDRTREMFFEGAPLCDMVEGRARFDLRLFTLGGLAILDAIERRRYDVLSARPTVGKLAKMRLLAGVLLGRKPRRRA